MTMSRQEMLKRRTPAAMMRCLPRRRMLSDAKPTNSEQMVNTAMKLGPANVCKRIMIKLSPIKSAIVALRRRSRLKSIS